MTDPGPALELAGVAKSYGRVVALDGVDLDLPRGRVLALLGPNGSGKTTLVGVASGLIRPERGTARVLGGSPRRARGVGVAPQEIGLYPALTVRQNLRFFGELHGLRAREARRRAEELLEPLSLTALGDRPAGRLSGGEQRRAHAAAALVHRPRLVLLDEPTAGADPQTRAGILELVRGLARDGAAVVYTTHYMHEVEGLAPDIALLHRGRVIARAPMGELLARHASAALLLDVASPAPPAVAALGGAPMEDGRLRVTCPDPAAALRDLLAALGDDAGALRGAQIVPASLEGAYLALVERAGARAEAPVP
ncbi:MAG: ABC transporter ATP-binding protein [Thermoleophilia bacterium]